LAGSVGEEVGRALRHARLARGFTLKEVGERSAGAFTPTAVAGYERAERTISIVRFYALCRFYGVAPAGVFAEIAEAVDGRPERIVDLTRLEGSTAASPVDGAR
jgi:transcriptional regulator with XRE-family HTH domain